MIDLAKVHYFGGCPECGKGGHFVNIGRDHWFYCEAHKTKWYVGSNLFSAWRDESEELWQRNERMLAKYREVECIDNPLNFVCGECGYQALQRIRATALEGNFMVFCRHGMGGGRDLVLHCEQGRILKGWWRERRNNQPPDGDDGQGRAEVGAGLSLGPFVW